MIPVPPFSKLPSSKYRLEGGFWFDIIQKLISNGLPSQWRHTVATERIENFNRVIRGETGTHKGYRFNDSDVYKLIDATACALKHRDSKELRDYMDLAVTAIEGAQREDGYVFTYVQLNDPDCAWTNIAERHEMYCAGHLVEAAVAMSLNLNDNRLLVVAEKFVKHIQNVFGPGKRIGFCGHPELELALYDLAELTGDLSYASTADWMVNMRGSRPSPFEADFDRMVVENKPAPSKFLYYKDGKYDGSYAQDHLPVREQKSIEGHAVRAAYLYTAAAMTAFRTDDSDLHTALVGLWENTVQKRMYITGGIGSSGTNEGFTEDYDLPNENAYAESCASIALALWGRAMFNVTGESAYIETVERTLFNGVLSGISSDTTRYLYDNPLESRKKHKREEWFGCACCPPNLARTVASIGSYAYSSSEGSVAIHFPLACTMQGTADGLDYELKVETRYPLDGKAEVTVRASKPVQLKILVRIPDWSEEVVTDVPGASEEAGFDRGYAVFDRVWKDGDTLKIDFNMTPTWVESNPRIMSNSGRIALMYGPTLYCAESPDQESAPQLKKVYASEEPPIQQGKAVDGSPLFVVPSTVQSLEFPEDAYSPLGTISESEDETLMLPYRTWGNRAENAGAVFMQVWLMRG